MSKERKRHQKQLRIAMLEMLAIIAGLHWLGFYPGTKEILANNMKFTISVLRVYIMLKVKLSYLYS
jgi:hypothetical protein